MNALLRELNCGPAEFVLFELSTGFCAHKLPFCLRMLGKFSLSAGKQERQNRRGELERMGWFSRKQPATLDPRGLSRSLFQNSLLQLFLAFNTMARPRHGFQPLGIDLFSARDAFAEVAFANAGERALHHLQQLPVGVALVEEKFFVVRTGGLVRNILRHILIGATAILLGA